MSVYEFPALAIQDWLRVFCYDSYCADAMTSGLTNSKDTTLHWQLAVDALYRLFASNLLHIPSLKADDFSTQKSIALDYIKSLARHDPFRSDIEETSHWYLWDISATDRCHRLIEKFGIRDLPQGELSQGFVAALHSLFAENQVAWSDQPLIVINTDQ
ncbi:hypothetical protein QYM18_15510 [Ectopseudomonas chengduensis]|nr:hypothetical protein [Pseudomonas chengduensis]WKC35875.1 hypothetical protein QYM18_15510 [Pseudomonas chengduensis]